MSSVSEIVSPLISNSAIDQAKPMFKVQNRKRYELCFYKNVKKLVKITGLDI